MSTPPSSWADINGRALKLTGAREAGWLNLKTSRLTLEQRDMVNPLSEQTRKASDG